MATPLTQPTGETLTKRNVIPLNNLAWRALGTLFRKLRAEVEANRLDPAIAGERYARVQRAFYRMRDVREMSSALARGGVRVTPTELLLRRRAA